MSDDPNAAPAPGINVERAENVNASPPLGKPSRRTVSVVWLTIVMVNALVMVIAAAALCYGLFVPETPTLVEPGIALALFTTPAAFLAGLVARDPGQHN